MAATATTNDNNNHQTMSMDHGHNSTGEKVVDGCSDGDSGDGNGMAEGVMA